MRDPLFRVLLLCSVLGAISAPSRANEIERHLREEYKGKTLLLRNFAARDQLAYDSNGLLVTTAREGDWTGFGIVRIREIKIARNQLNVDANRIQADPTENGFQLISGGRVRIVADLGLEQPSVEKAEVLFSKIFLTTHDDFAEAVPDYWKPCVFAALSGNVPQEYRACKFSDDFLKIPGVVMHPEDKTDPKGLPQSIAGSISYEVLRTGKGITPPRRISGEEPVFTDQARRAKYSGGAMLGLVVGPTGAVEKIWIISPAGYGLTLSALKSVAAWRFQPATKDGQPVAVQVAVQMTFNIYTNPQNRR